MGSDYTKVHLTDYYTLHQQEVLQTDRVVYTQLYVATPTTGAELQQGALVVVQQQDRTSLYTVVQQEPLLLTPYRPVVATAAAGAAAVYERWYYLGQQEQRAFTRGAQVLVPAVHTEWAAYTVVHNEYGLTTTSSTPLLLQETQTELLTAGYYHSEDGYWSSAQQQWYKDLTALLAAGYTVAQ
jgi:hypothetical protein